jgi:hypothetical protein
MHRIGVGNSGGLDQRIYGEVALCGRCRTDADCAIRFPDMDGAGVGVRVDSHALDCRLAAGTDDPYRDLAAIRDEHAP